MKKRVVLIFLILASIILLYTCGSDRSSTSADRSTATKTKKITKVDSNKENYSEVSEADYDSWNHEDLEEGSKVKFSGTVVQTVDDGDKVALRIAVNGDYDKMVYALINEDFYKDTVSEDDLITVYGYAFGRYSYKSTFDKKVTIPYMEVAMYEDYRTENYKSKMLYNQDGIVLEQTNFDTFKLSNNSGSTIKSSIESVDIGGQVISSSLLYDLSSADLSSGQWKEAKLESHDHPLKAGDKINIRLKIMNTNYDTIAEIPINFNLEKTLIK